MSISLMPSEMTETVTRKITQPKRHKLRTNSNEVSLNAVHPRQVKARATSQLFWDESQLAVELADDDLMDSIAAARKRAGQTAAAYQRLFDPITRLWSHYSSNSTTPGSGSSGNANGNNNSQSLESPMTVMPQSRKPSTSNSANGLFGSDDLDIKQKTTKTTTRKTKGTKNKISTSAATSTITSASASISISISTSTSISASTSTFTSACASPSTSTSTSTNTNTSTNTTVNATANTTANTTVTASSTTQPTKKPNSRLTRLLKKFSL
ncbi:hypothetical protein J3Q64DRAFT_1735360 [Phycomyces blakesleeanus]|uniref:Uncharacterized protein n=1 Tax=Phycomyces blakesleeanus TaxID=4837 RepID=A0ABR3B3H8_PHYBL